MGIQKDKPKAAVAKTGAGAVAASTGYGEHADGGFENQTRADISIPFINVIQDNSPECESQEEARPGMLYNTVTGEFISSEVGVLLIPALTEHVFVEWVPRDDGGGFVGIHQPTSEVVSAAQKAAKDPFKLKHGKNDLIETFYIYASVLDEDNEISGMAVIACTSKKIAPYRKWNTSLNSFMVKIDEGNGKFRKQRPPLFAHQVRLTTWRDSNKHGKFWNIALKPANGSVANSILPPGDARLESTSELRDMVLEGHARADHDTQHKGESTVDTEGSPASDRKEAF